MKKRILSILLLMFMLLAGCGSKEPSVSLSDRMTANSVSTDLDATKKGTVADFAVDLFQNSLSENGDTLISPMSVLYALAMTANGAEGETLSQMEKAFGMKIDDLNQFLHAYMTNLPQSEKYKLCLANAIWFRDSENFHVNDAFLQANADYYGAGIYKAPFDKETLDEINQWVNDNTEERIQKILEEISNDAVMYLLNALTFDAEWETPYSQDKLQDTVFTQEDGKKENVPFMYSKEYTYLKDTNATGFVKYYKDQKYAFVALLPDEGVTVADYVKTLSGDSVCALLENASDEEVEAAIPKFASEYEIEMVDALKTMGMTDAFDMKVADLSGIGTNTYAENLYISTVIHKTYISVDEKGTEAGAATAVGVNKMAMLPTKQVYLNRPFVYMIIDCEVELPIFMGTVMNIPGTK